MMRKIPRVLLAAPSSGSGKTTTVCAVMELLRRRGLTVNSFKCGPDYIDPMFHKAVLGIDGGNLDPFFCGQTLLKSLLPEGSDGDVSVIEGVMGYYDGTGNDGTENSTYSVARAVKAPVILIVNGKGAAASLLALIEGFVRFRPDSGIRGVLFNHVTPMTYRLLKRLTEDHFGAAVVPVGFIPELPEDCVLGSRHLGLITAGEVRDLRAKLDKIADICRETIDTDAIMRLADAAEDLDCEKLSLPEPHPFTLAVAHDRAFCFYYRDTFRLLERMGAVIRCFSPLSNEPVPGDADGLLIGGGYPELYAETLERNAVSRESIAACIRSGMPAIAECGGFQYLGTALGGYKMCGVLPHTSADTGKLVRFGYVTLTAQRDGLLGKAGTRLPAHEFHYYDSTENGSDFIAEKPNGRAWECGITNDTLYAGYPHLYLTACIPAAEAFCNKCTEYRAKRNGK